MTTDTTTARLRWGDYSPSHGDYETCPHSNDRRGRIVFENDSSIIIEWADGRQETWSKKA